MPFDIVPRRDLSLADLVRIHQAGGSVMKTPHVGNVYTNNLAVASLGIRLTVYDRTVGRKDRNFHPHRLVARGRSEVIAHDERLTTHNRVMRSPSVHGDRFPVGARVLDCHMRALRDALPEAEIDVYTDYLRRHADRVHALMRAATDTEPRIWERFVGADGTVYERGATGWPQIEALGIYGLDHRESGWIIPNIGNVLIAGVVEVVERGVPEVYHLSGPDMINYVTGMERDLHRLYDAARRVLGWSLPERLVMNLVPVADMRFAVPSRQRAALEEVVSAYRAVVGIRLDRANRMRGANGNRAALIAEFDQVQDRAFARLRDAIRACPDIFYRIERADAFTQYDLLDGEGFFIHPWGVEAPQSEVSAALAVCERTRSTI